MTSTSPKSSINISAGKKAVELMRDTIEMTYTPEVMSDTGTFGGLYDACGLSNMTSPVLVSVIAGIGGKSRFAQRMDRWGTIGKDLVNHCVNDLLVQGGKPLFFLDYISTDQLHPEQIAIIVNGMAAGCLEAGCALIGGETTEMKNANAEGEIEIAGTMVGVVERDNIIDGTRISDGDVIIGLPSSGIHSSGSEFIENILADFDWRERNPSLGESIGEALLTVHRSYLKEIQRLQTKEIPIHGISHITGGGMVANIPRILPANRQAIIQQGSWHTPHIFEFIQKTGNLSDSEMYNIFNMGVGMAVIVPRDQQENVQRALPHARVIGEIVEGERRITFKR